MHGGAGFLDFVQQNFGAAQGQLLFILADGRQAGDAVLPKGNAVIPRDGDILRDAQTVILQSALSYSLKKTSVSRLCAGRSSGSSTRN